MVTTVGVAAMLTPGLFVWGEFVNVPDDATNFEAVGKQWHWSFRLPGADGQLGNSDVRHMTVDNPLGVDRGGPDRPGRHHHRESDDAPARRSTRASAAAFDRRSARLRGTAVPRENGPRAGPRDLPMVHAYGPGHLRDPLRGALRHGPLRDARQGRRRRAGRVSGLARAPADVCANASPTRSATPPPAPPTTRCARHATVRRARARATDGQPRGNKRPKLAGLDDWYIRRQLQHYQTGVRGTTPGDLFGAADGADVAGRGRPDGSRERAGVHQDAAGHPGAAHDHVGDLERGARLYDTCSACHGQNGEGRWGTNAPRLAGMSDWYLERQLQ